LTNPKTPIVMKKFLIFVFIVPVLLVCFSCGKQAEKGEKIVLKENWTIQSSAQVDADGAGISTIGYEPEGWVPATMPSTVLAALVKNGVYPDPYFGTNVESLPGYITGRRRQMPEDSPFRVAWWYRTEFNVPSGYRAGNTWLHFNSINYRANIWLNGKLLDDTSAVEGAYRLYDFDITDYVVPGKSSCLALEIFPPKGMDLTITWVDWNPTPPDMGMGIWYDVTIHSTGKVAIEDPHVITDLDLPSLDVANLTVSAGLRNAGESQVTGTLKGVIEDIEFVKEVTLEAGEATTVTFAPEEFPQLSIDDPRLWWPHTVGPQNLYDMTLTFETGGRVSDVKKERFGIREITSHMNRFDGKRTTVFQVNGKDIVIRGGGYVEDMMLRPDNNRIEADIQYAKHMNLNALRMEAPRGPDYIFDLCDEEGILLMVGWCCCSSWERWRNWTPHTGEIARESWKDQIVRLRNHPSVFDWLYGSDGPPPALYEQPYVDVLDQYDGTRPYQSSATQDSSDIAGYTGLYMGPYPEVYAYCPPSYWYNKLEFNTEAAPAGEQIPPLESLRKMMPEEELWPMGRSWDIRLHPRFDPPAREALYSRYGEPVALDEYIKKSQVLQLEAVRAMFEAYAGNKYRSSGIIYWMYNSAWPSLYWQLYDYFLTPNGAFYGARKACEQLHIQYSYGDSAIYVVNGNYHDYENLKATARVYNFDMTEKYVEERSLAVQADESKRIMDLDLPDDLSDVYFLKLELLNEEGLTLSSNFYWLSVKGDAEADFTDLKNLPEVDLDATVSSILKEGNTYNLVVDLENTSPSLAFSVNPKIIKKGTRDLVAPIFWDENYISLLPGEKRSVKVSFNVENLDGETPVLEIEGWNIKSQEIAVE
jgi:exo-1,4-beta-D-glucosaminidase